MEAMTGNRSGSLCLSRAAGARWETATLSEEAGIDKSSASRDRTTLATENMHLLPIRQHDQPQGPTSERMVQRHGQQGRGQTLSHGGIVCKT